MRGGLLALLLVSCTTSQPAAPGVYARPAMGDDAAPNAPGMIDIWAEVVRYDPAAEEDILDGNQVVPHPGAHLRIVAPAAWAGRTFVFLDPEDDPRWRSVGARFHLRVPAEAVARGKVFAGTAVPVP